MSEETMFDPSKTQGEGEGGVPAGEHLIALVWFERKRSKAGKFYMRCKFEVCSGDLAGRTFYATQSLAESSYGRLGVWCSCVGVTERFDLEDQKALSGAFAYKPFKAKIKVTTSGQYTNHDIERFVPKLSDAEQKAARGWVLDRAEEAAMGGASDEEKGDDIPFDSGC